MNDKTYLSCAETAKLIRVALKKAFPGIKFSVRSHTYSGGASIDVDWTDGPSKKAVEGVAKVYAGGGFDGMIDMAYNVSTWLLPDGSATWGKSIGTEGSMGVVSAYNYEKPCPEAKLVNFGADFVFCNKHWSVPVYTDAATKVCKVYGVDMPEIIGGCVGPYVKPDPYVPNGNAGLSTLIHRELCEADA